MVGPEDVLRTWLDELQPADWYQENEALDQKIRDTFLATWKGAREGRHSLWLTYTSGTLAYVILTDQFSRNMFRGTGQAFATDRIGLAAAKSALAKGWDMKIDEPARQFFYMPLMHSENLCDQDRCVRLVCERLPLGRESTLLHARAHREVIRQFGRFPYRNAALGRKSTTQESAYIAAGGYASTLWSLQEAAAA